jgi:WD40 repeat protein
MPEMENLWTYVSPDTQEVQIRTQLDPTATIVISSSTAKTVTIYDADNGQPIVKCCPGEITTAMCLSNNSKQLITASDKGVIYIWKIPESLTERLQNAKN